MANRIFDNVIIIDSAMSNLPAVGGTSANITTFNIQSIALWASSTLGNVVLTGAMQTKRGGEVVGPQG